MLYILETKLRENTSISKALLAVYGIGTVSSALLCKKLGFSSNLKVKQLTRIQINDLLRLINLSDLLINNELRKKESLGLKLLISIKSYRGLRRLAGLPVRGQRTHTNAKSAAKQKTFH